LNDHLSSVERIVGEIKEELKRLQADIRQIHEEQKELKKDIKDSILNMLNRILENNQTLATLAIEKK
jgi:peptidoglycan hydrolase CwlO-like protein